MATRAHSARGETRAPPRRQPGQRAHLPDGTGFLCTGVMHKIADPCRANALTVKLFQRCYAIAKETAKSLILHRFIRMPYL